MAEGKGLVQGRHVTVDVVNQEKRKVMSLDVMEESNAR
jgi:hypothetical protein